MADNVGHDLRVLLVEDSPDDAFLVERELRASGYSVVCLRVETQDDMTSALRDASWDLVISDYEMPTFNGLDALGVLQRSGAEIPFIMVSGRIGEDVAVQAMRAGAQDYLLKGNLTRLVPAVERELREYAERRRLEEAVRHSQKMDAVGRLAGGVAHDFNNLITVITTFAGFIRDATVPGDPRRGDIVEVLRAADRAAGLTRQLLAFSRRQPSAPCNVDLNELIVNLDKMLRRTLGEHVELVTLPSPQRQRVHVDPGQLEQVLLNLAVNARDAMPDGGRLTIEASSSDSGELVCLRVSDTGSGMDSETFARAFEPFFTTKEEGKGTGLGLATCYGLIKQAGGEIVIDTELERGTSVLVTLPRAADPEGTPMNEATPSSAMTGTETVLVVEDEPALRAAMTRMLEGHGYQILTAANGEQALAMHGSQLDTVALVVTDVVMPRMNGRTLCERLRTDHPDLCVLFVTGYADPPDERDSRSVQTDVLYKPFGERDLLARVRYLLDRRT